jgi:hypothetical protein
MATAVCTTCSTPVEVIMRRNPNVKQMSMVALALPLCGLVAGCAARRPVAELARADQAVLHAQTTSDAASVAPAELATAQAKLTGARRAMADGNDAIARDLADQARAYAELAEEKAEAQRTVGAARHTLSEVEVIQAESAASPDTVVVERRTVTRTAPAAVVVERPATQNVVIEHVPPPPAPVNVVVDRPAAGVVVEHAPPVVVLPE